MLLNNSINRKNLNQITIKSLVWNSIIEVFKSKKNIDVKPYLTSIQIRWNNIIIKLNKSIIKSEIMQIQDEILKEVKHKFGKIWIKFFDFELKFVV